MKTLNMPGFTAEASLNDNPASYAGSYDYRKQVDRSNAGKIVPALPRCANCPWILDNCERNGWRPTGLCNLCATGSCY